MKIDKIRDLVHAVPFQPFTLLTPGGPPIHVPHPDFIALSPDGRTVLVYAGEGGSHKVINVSLIGQIDVFNTASQDA